MLLFTYFLFIICIYCFKK